MRELKFRTYDFVMQRYDDAPEMYATTDGHLEPSSNRIIEQFTGIKDKNGKEIYEGDIVHNTAKVASNKSTTYQIYYDQTYAMYGMSPVDGKIDIGDFYGYKMRQSFEVIGNIHENHELLEEK